MKNIIKKIKNQKSIIKNCLIVVAILVGCETAYVYDYENAHGDHTAEEADNLLGGFTGIDVSQYHAARVFPGLVDTLIDRTVDTTILLDFRKRHIPAATVLAQYVPEPIYSTGLYAGAGEEITIILGENLYGLTVVIGSHTTELPGSIVRTPIVHTRQALFPGGNTLRNPYGGYIWITRNNNVGDMTELPLTINGAYRAPDFIKGTTNPQQWAARIRNTTVPWLELRGERVAFSVPRNRIEEMINTVDQFSENIEDVLETWDYAIENYYYYYYGMRRNDSEQRNRMPDYPERVILDVQLPGNLLITWGGQPIWAINSGYMLDELANPNIVMAGMSTAVIVSLANNYTLPRSPFWSAVQTAATVIPQYRIAEKGFLEGKAAELPEIFTEDNNINYIFPVALDFANADSSKRRVDNPAYDLLFFIQLAHYNNNNWAFYEGMMKNIRETMTGGGFGGPIVTNDAITFFTSLCDYFEMNFAPFFDRYGYVIPDRTRATIDLKYPLISNAIWRYDPLSTNPNENVTQWNGEGYRYFTDRTDWGIWTLDANLFDNWDAQDNRPASYIIDGNYSSSWHSAWSTAYGGVRPKPHYVVIDLKKATEMDGFYIATATNGNQPVSSVYFDILEDTSDLDDFQYDPTLQWIQKAFVGPRLAILGPVDPDTDERPIIVPAYEWEPAYGIKEPAEGIVPRERSSTNRYFDFQTPVTARYIRLRIPYVSLYGALDHSTLGEFGTYTYTK